MRLGDKQNKAAYNKSCHSLPAAAGTPLRGAHAHPRYARFAVRVIFERGILLHHNSRPILQSSECACHSKSLVILPMHAGCSRPTFGRWPAAPVMVSFVRGFPKIAHFILLRTWLSGRKFHRCSSSDAAFKLCKIGEGRCVWATDLQSCS